MGDKNSSWSHTTLSASERPLFDLRVLQYSLSPSSIMDSYLNSQKSVDDRKQSLKSKLGAKDLPAFEPTAFHQCGTFQANAELPGYYPGIDVNGIWIPPIQNSSRTSSRSGPTYPRSLPFESQAIGNTRKVLQSMLQLLLCPERKSCMLFTEADIPPSLPILQTLAAITRGLLQHIDSVHRAFSVEYRLSSGDGLEAQSPFPAALLDALWYVYLVKTVGFDPSDIIVEALEEIWLALTRYLVELKTPAFLLSPSALILLSAHGLTSVLNPPIQTHHVDNSKSDYIGIVDGDGLLRSIRAFRTSWSRGCRDKPDDITCFTEPCDEDKFQGFPRTFIAAGGAEVFYDMFSVLNERMVNDLGEGDGVRPDDGKVHWHCSPDATHDWVAVPYHEPEPPARPPLYPHATSLRNQPFRTLYLTFDFVGTVLVRAPLWLLLSIPNHGVLVLHGLSKILSLYNSFAILSRFGPVGDLAIWSRAASVSSKPVRGYWYCKNTSATPNTLRMASSGEKILYSLHGGAYTSGTAHPSGTNAKLVRDIMHLDSRINRTFAIEYRLSSDASNPFPAALIDALAGYHYLVHSIGFNPLDIVIEGSASGGNLALALTRYLIDYYGHSDVPELPDVPESLILLSPWVDILANDETHIEPTIRSWLVSDYMFGPRCPMTNYSKQIFLGPHGIDVAALNEYISPSSRHL
ncbi:hypothetical protein DFJ43DRAFT_1162393 [Lentinula guzmanii]|uniref:Alpha/beta hydrolase fold-3 domain-containing protein n=1 Tax=Lentinula guzmanii TaxID=2804957 RepID=A0AA38MU10_9AGAR|nr:hypothetical protein DFJ43DRAFT_1162393 [Lentinula guzmanii]